MRKKIKEWCEKEKNVKCERKKSRTVVRNIEGTRTSPLKREFEGEREKVEKRRKLNMSTATSDVYTVWDKLERSSHAESVVREKNKDVELKSLVTIGPTEKDVRENNIGGLSSLIVTTTRGENGPMEKRVRENNSGG